MGGIETATKRWEAWCRAIEVLEIAGMKSHQSCRRSTMDGGLGRRGMTLITNGCCCGSHARICSYMGRCVNPPPHSWLSLCSPAGSMGAWHVLQWRQFSQVRFSSKLPLKPSICLQVSELHILQSRLNIDIAQLYLSSCCFSPATS